MCTFHNVRARYSNELYVVIQRTTPSAIHQGGTNVMDRTCEQNGGLRSSYARDGATALWDSRTGRPKLRWVDSVAQDSISMGINNRKNAAQDSKRLRRLLAEAKTRQGL
jgi:hypothetical protein